MGVTAAIQPCRGPLKSWQFANNFKEIGTPRICAAHSAMLRRTMHRIPCGCAELVFHSSIDLPRYITYIHCPLRAHARIQS
jgi:hypothetical protein